MTSSNVPNLIAAMQFLRRAVSGRIALHLGETDSIEIEGPSYTPDNSPFAVFIETHQPSLDEYLTLLVTLAPHIEPNFFDSIIAEHLPEGTDLPEFGGLRSMGNRGFIPTGETVLFILAGNNLEQRLQIRRFFNSTHWFSQKNILYLETVPEGEPVMSGKLVPDAELVELLTLGTVSKPRFTPDFPAQYIQTELSWTDLILAPATMRQIKEIEHWVQHQHTFYQTWGMSRKIKPGYRALFHGPPGTGKTLTATLLGKYTGRDVFRIDLSTVISKYIGETEKNLDKIFRKAENKTWILFFDEADALFGKRTGVRDAHDKYANQEVSYLLQRLENFSGLVILASNFRSNIDEAFTRRFHSIVYFPIPKPAERLLLWQQAFPTAVTVTPDVLWPHIAQQYELTGSNIMNIVQYTCLKALSENTTIITLADLQEGIAREFTKEDKIS